MKYLGQSFYIIVAPNPGADATRYWLTVNANQIKRNSDGTFTPGSVVAARMQQVGQSSPALSTTGNIKFVVHYKNGTSSPSTNYLAPVVVRMDMLDVIFSYYIDNIVVDTQTVTILADGESAVTYEITFADENGLAANTIPCNDKGVPQLGQEYFANLYQIVGSTKSLCNLYYARIKYTDTATGAEATEESGMATGIYDFRVADYNYFTVQFYNPVNLKVIAESSIGKVYNGSAGLPGPAGMKGAMPFPSGIWNAALTYTMTEDITPIVYYEPGNTYYVMRIVKSVTGLNPSNDYAANGSSATWIPFTNYKAIYTEILMANFAKLGSGVFWGDYLFSQQGVDANNNPTSNYRDFDANRLDEPDAPFKPNLLMDFMSGGMRMGLDNLIIDSTNKLPNITDVVDRFNLGGVPVTTSTPNGVLDLYIEGGTNNYRSDEGTVSNYVNVLAKTVIRFAVYSKGTFYGSTKSEQQVTAMYNDSTVITPYEVDSNGSVRVYEMSCPKAGNVTVSVHTKIYAKNSSDSGGNIMLSTAAMKVVFNGFSAYSGSDYVGAGNMMAMRDEMVTVIGNDGIMAAKNEHCFFRLSAENGFQIKIGLHDFTVSQEGVKVDGVKL